MQNVELTVQYCGGPVTASVTAPMVRTLQNGTICIEAEHVGSTVEVTAVSSK